MTFFRIILVLLTVLLCVSTFFLVRIAREDFLRSRAALAEVHTYVG